MSGNQLGLYVEIISRQPKTTTIPAADFDGLRKAIDAMGVSVLVAAGAIGGYANEQNKKNQRQGAETQTKGKGQA